MSDLYSTQIDILAKLLGCKNEDCGNFDSILYPIDDLWETVTEYTVDGICKAVYQESLKDLIGFHTFVKEKIQQNPKLYDGSVLEWDSDLLWESLEFLDPERDLNYGLDNSGFYLELDYWDLYTSVIETILDDYGESYNFHVWLESFCKNVYGGKDVPSKFEPLLI